MDAFREWSEALKALADPTRLHIVALLAREPHCVCELVQVLGVSQPTVSHHLARLRHARIVRERRSGQWNFYHLEKDRIPFLEALVATLPDVDDEVRAVKEDEGLACHAVMPRVSGAPTFVVGAGVAATARVDSSVEQEGS